MLRTMIAGSPPLPSSQVYWYLWLSNSVVVKLFLDRGTNPNMSQAHIGTPLMLALSGTLDCPFEVIAALLEHGVGSRQGHSTVVGPYPGAVQLAVGTYSLPVFRAVFKFCCLDEKERWNGLGKTALPLAVALNQADVVQYLLGKGADADGPAHRSGFKLGTPLHIAISEGYVEVAEVLLAHGADVELVLQLQPNLIQDIQGTEGAKEMTELLVSRISEDLLATYGPR